MTPELAWETPRHLLKAYLLARYWRRVLPELPRWTTCHALTRAFCPGLNEIAGVRLEVVDGYFGAAGSATHSWLVDPAEPAYVLDVYPWAAVAGPMLVSVETLSPWYNLYRGEDGWLRNRLATGDEQLLIGWQEARQAVGELVRRTSAGEILDTPYESL